MNNPYEELGVPVDANEEEIKKAYRKNSKKNHPDTGGDLEKMRDLIKAYDILSDPGKRKRFDETGSVEPEPPIENDIRQAFFQICEELLFKQENVDIKHFLKIMKDNAERLYSNAIQEIEKKEKLIKSSRERIKQKPEIDLLGAIIEQKLRDLENQRKIQERGIEIARKAFVMFEEYTFEKGITYGYSLSMFGMASFH